MEQFSRKPKNGYLKAVIVEGESCGTAVYISKEYVRENSFIPSTEEAVKALRGMGATANNMSASAERLVETSKALQSGIAAIRGRLDERNT